MFSVTVRDHLMIAHSCALERRLTLPHGMLTSVRISRVLTELAA